MFAKLKTYLRQALIRWSTPIYGLLIAYGVWGYINPAHMMQHFALILIVYGVWKFFENPILIRFFRRKEYYSEEEKGNVPKVH